MLASSRRSQGRRAPKTSASRNGRRRPRLTGKGARAKVRGYQGNGSRSKLPARQSKLDAKVQAAVKNFEAATRYFNQQNYAKANELFQKVKDEASREIAERARVHISLCEQKLAKPAPARWSPADYYNLGVAELNARNLDLAVEYLTKADKAAPNRDEIRYALAAARALQGNIEVAFEHLKAAIALRPENRFLARHDEDFEPLRSDPRYRSLIYPESNSSLA